MKIKKTLLLASALVSLILMIAPVTGAQGEASWWTDFEGGPVEVKLGEGTENAEEFTFTGELSTTMLGFRSGPCNTAMTVQVWNTKNGGTGEVTDLESSATCGTNVPGCEVNGAESSLPSPWHLDVVGDTSIRITGANIATKYNDGCTGLGIPPGVAIGASGTLTGSFSSLFACISFNGSGHMKRELTPVELDGELCDIFSNLTLST